MFRVQHLIVSADAERTLLRDSDLDPALKMHTLGNWGEQDDSGWRRNDRNLAQRGKVESVFSSTCGPKFLIVTDLVRNVTHVRLQAEP